MNKAIIITGGTIVVAAVSGLVAINTHKGSDAIIGCQYVPEKIRNMVTNYRAKCNAKAAAKAAEDVVKAEAKAAAAADRSAQNVFTRAAGKATG